MVLALDAVGPGSAGKSGNVAAGTPTTWSHTCSGSNRILFVEVACSEDVTALVAVSYNSVAMTHIISRQSNDQTAGGVHLYGLINPASGANTVSVTVAPAAGSDYEAGSVSYNGADQTTGWKNATSNAGSVTGGTHPITGTISGTTTGNIVLAAACYGSAITAGAGVGTNRWAVNQNNSSAAGNAACGDNAVTGSSTQVAWDSTSGDWFGWVGVEIIAAGGAVTDNGALAVTATASITFGGKATHGGALAVTARASAVFGGTATHKAALSLTAGTSLTLNGTATHKAALSMSSLARLTISATTTHFGAFIPHATAQFTLNGTTTHFGSLNVHALTQLTLGATTTHVASLSMSSRGVLVLGATTTHGAALALHALALLSVSGSTAKQGDVLFTSRALLSLTGLPTHRASLSLTSVASFALSGSRTAVAAIALNSRAVLVIAGNRTTGGAFVPTVRAIIVFAGSTRVSLPPASGKVAAQSLHGSAAVITPSGGVKLGGPRGMLSPGKLSGRIR